MLISGYVNAAIFVVPVITFLLGDPKAAILGNLLQVIVIQSIFITLLGMLLHREKTILQRIWVSISNPFVAMPTIGLVCNYLQLTPPAVLATMIKTLGSGASGIALFVFGLTLSGLRIQKENISRDLWLVVFMKNILHPVIAFLIGSYVFCLDQYWLQSLMIATSAPTAFVVYLIAKQFSVEMELAKMAVGLSSIISMGSLALIILVL